MLSEQIVFLDGATGTVLQQKGMKPGYQPERLNIENPAMLADVCAGYAGVGSQIVMANTFGANPLKLRNCPYPLQDVVTGAIKAARAGAPDCMVALDVGPLGELMEPMGSLRFEQAYEHFTQVMEAGKKAGADLVMIETMSDLLETKAALLAAKENTDLPVFVSMSFEADGRTFTGCTIESMGMTLSALGADAIGMNCSVGPDKLARLIERLARVTDLPIICKPNAGLPDPEDGHYDMSPDAFLGAMEECVKAGASVIGGCCGTTPAYIEKLTERFARTAWKRRFSPDLSMVCTPTRPVFVDQVRMIGERINPTGKKRFQKALLEKDLDYIISVAIEQRDAGADLLDVNVGFPGVDEVEMLPLVVRKIQSVVDLPLQLDSSNPEALAAALRIYNGKPSVNSINAKQEVMDDILPAIKKYGACVIGLTIDEDGIPDSAKKRIELAGRIASEAEKYDIPHADLWIDPLCLTVSAQQDQAKETLKAVRYITDQMHLNTVLGVSNISFGLPERKLMTSTFLIQAMTCGLRLPIVNVNQPEIVNAIAACKVLLDQDKGSEKYIERFANVSQTSAQTSVLRASSSPSASASVSAASQDGNKSALSLQEAVIQGLAHPAADLARERLQLTGCSELSIVEDDLIPALDEVGRRYEAKTMFLPQLLSAAQAAQSVFEVLRTSMADKGVEEVKKGRIVLATVQGDVHDIGKNIVKTVLENYGFDVIDLGKDVAPEIILQTVKDQNIQLVGLSALMTTTLPAMEKTIELLHTLENPPKIMVGGAVVTKEYAKKAGADFYGKDASESAAYARKVFGV